jgi:glycosyltransferase involved in cell wall biosynthesis
LKRVIVSVTNDLSTDQRVAKTCRTLHKLNYEVLLVGRKLKGSLPIERAYTTKRFRLIFNRSFLFYAEYNLRLFFFLLFCKKDLLFSNDLDTLLPNYLISKLQNKKLVYDSHELFTEIPELIEKPFVKNVWSRIERAIFPKLKNVIVVSEAIANHYQEKYGVSCHVIRNLPEVTHHTQGQFPFDTSQKKVILYQGSLNIGRGVELMIDTIPLLKDTVLVIIGHGDITTSLKKKVVDLELDSRIFFLGAMAPQKLKELTPLASIGLSLEEDLGLNYRFALPNKLFDYIQAEIPVIVSDLPEMKNIVSHYKVGEILTNRTPKELAQLILSIEKKEYLSALQKAKKELNWNTESEKLISIFNHL